MKPFSKLVTYNNEAGEQTVSEFVTMYVEIPEDRNQQPYCVVRFKEYKLNSDGSWKRPYEMWVRLTTILDVYFIDKNDNNLKKKLFHTVDGLPMQVQAAEFELMRFMCWDNNFASLKKVCEDGLLRRKKVEDDIRNNMEPAPHDFTLDPRIPPELLIAYLDDLKAHENDDLR